MDVIFNDKFKTEKALISRKCNEQYREWDNKVAKVCRCVQISPFIIQTLHSCTILFTLTSYFLTHIQNSLFTVSCFPVR